MKKYVDESQIPNLINQGFENYTLLASYTRADKTTMPEAEKFTLTTKEPLTNYVFLFVCVRATGYAMGCSTIPSQFFKNSGLYFELNCMNDQEKLFHGNIYYVDDNTVTGKISGESTGFEVYGLLKVGG